MLCTGMSMISVWTRFGYEIMYSTDRLPGYSMDYMGKEKEQIWMVQPDLVGLNIMCKCVDDSF